MSTGLHREPAVGWPVLALVGLAGTMAAVASGAGVALRGSLETVPFTTVRGDVVDVLTDGIYRFNGEAVATEGIGWDAVTLAIVPVLVATLPALRRGSLRAALLTMGLLAYLLYQYAQYAMFLAYGPLFLVYVAIVAASASALAVLLGRIDLAELAARVDMERFPRRGVVGFGLFMAILLLGMWLPLVGRTLGAERVPELAGATTLVVQAFDLGFLVPLGLALAIAATRRLPAGYLLAPIVLVKGASMGAAIAAMLVVEGAVGGALEVVPILGFAVIGLVSLVLAGRVMRSIRPVEAVSEAPAIDTMVPGAVRG